MTVDDIEDPDWLYELFRIAVHIGRYVFHVYVALSGGVSYVAIVRGPQSWLIFDDDKSSLSRNAKYLGTLVVPPPEHKAPPPPPPPPTAPRLWRQTGRHYLNPQNLPFLLD
ncbi:hypothetical protein BGW80DRAFT_1310132 [Lactifluus volemus]|nr:hypothetical protein BGW80DRAFT_1310132 [Lactifluus volemus]